MSRTTQPGYSLSNPLLCFLSVLRSLRTHWSDAPEEHTLRLTLPPQLGAEVTSHKPFSHLAPLLTLRNVSFFFPGCPVLSQLRSHLSIWRESSNTKATKGSYLRTSRGQMAIQSPQRSWSRAAVPLWCAFYQREVRGIPFYTVLDFCLVSFLPLFRSFVPLVY